MGEIVKAWVAKINQLQYSVTPAEASALMEIAGGAEICHYGKMSNGEFGLIVKSSEQKPVGKSFLTAVELHQVELIDDLEEGAANEPVPDDSTMPF